jgi:arylsulfatase A-like enzyme
MCLRVFAAILCWLAVPLAADAGAADPAAAPNVLIILADDLGRTDLGVDGSPFHETPHLDALARSGVRFTDFYSAHPVCSPTRAALMTGKVPQRVGITDYIRPGTGVALADRETTIAEAFQANGYQTAYLGKWHLGEGDADQPAKHGFEWTSGVNRAGQPGSYFFPYRRLGDRPSVWDVPDFEDGKSTDYLTDVITTRAIEFLRNRDAARPFFLCLGHYAVHAPIQPPANLPKKYREKRAELYRDAAAPPIAAGFGAVSRVRQDDADYAAMVENLDTNIGRVLSALDELRLRQTTIVVFTSDNGGLSTLAGDHPGPTCNLPWRSGKGWNYEGGIRVPAFIAWPGRLKPGTTSVPAYTADLFPTLLELCGLPLQPRQHLDGQSLVSALSGDPQAALLERPLTWYYPHEHGSGHKPSAAIRRGNWKLLYYLASGQTELYDLDRDPAESTDLSALHTARTDSLRQELLRWIQATQR